MVRTMATDEQRMETKWKVRSAGVRSLAKVGWKMAMNWKPNRAWIPGRMRVAPLRVFSQLLFEPQRLGLVGLHPLA